MNAAYGDMRDLKYNYTRLRVATAVHTLANVVVLTRRRLNLQCIGSNKGTNGRPGAETDLEYRPLKTREIRQNGELLLKSY